MSLGFETEDASSSPHTALLGSEFTGWDEASQTASMRFTVRREMCTWRGGVQGGLIAGYLDEVMGYLISHCRGVRKNFYKCSFS